RITKNDLKTPGKAVQLISTAVGTSNPKVIILDIGGYFAPCLAELAEQNPDICGWTLMGIVEDTENGHKKYHEALERFRPLPQNLKPPLIYSVARSQMKMTEDYNVGKSLVRAADSILRHVLDLRLEEHPVIGVLGFGKIGSSIAAHLRQLHIGKVIVYDVNPAILLRAASHDFVICSKEQMLQQASFIFCATGNKALNFNDLVHIGSDIDRLIIASCTSADDELDVHEGLSQYEHDMITHEDFTRYLIRRQDGTNVEIILLCNGNAVNFSRRAILGESIRAVQAAMMVCALNLSRPNPEHTLEAGILTLANEEEMTIARLWLQHFSKLHVRLITNVMIGEGATEDDSDFPVDQASVDELKKYLGLQRASNTDPIDFMDSERKIIITEPRGSGNSTLIWSLIRDVRNYYDLIWWFDCNDPPYGVMMHLAQRSFLIHVGESFFVNRR
ncbi:unnamed protein product, partial [Rotaria sp. Silwood1]